MKVKELIKELSNTNPEAELVLFDGGEKVTVAGIAVNDNDDSTPTEIAVIDEETLHSFM